MWEPQRLTTLWAFRACYRESFTFYLYYNVKKKISNRGKIKGGEKEKELKKRESKT
jgi:hypothetical protein